MFVESLGGVTRFELSPLQDGRSQFLELFGPLGVVTHAGLSLVQGERSRYLARFETLGVVIRVGPSLSLDGRALPPSWHFPVRYGYILSLEQPLVRAFPGVSLPCLSQLRELHFPGCWRVVQKLLQGLPRVFLLRIFLRG